MMSCFQNLIQEDMQMKSVYEQWKLLGLVCLGEEHNSMQNILTAKWVYLKIKQMISLHWVCA